MSDRKFQGDKCRVCWEEDIELDWNNFLSGHSHLTYKDCYYKFTRIEFVNDNFSNMICLKCSNGLEYIEAFISKAINTNVKLHEMLLQDLKNKSEEDYVSAPSTCKSICTEEIEIKEEVENSPFCDHSSKLEEKNSICLVGKTTKTLLTKTGRLHRGKHTKVMKVNNSKGETKYISKTKSKNKNNNGDTLRKNKEKLRKVFNSQLEETEFIEMKENKCDIYELTTDATSEQYLNKVSDSKSTVSFNKTKAKSGEERKQIYLCQYCSFQVKGRTKLKIHEAAHSEGRKRTETCSQCGVKFFTKASLRLHEKTHDAKREKQYKCEFCEKAFFNNSTLNVHKRIHLGLMVKCQICSKEFFRKIELHNHMKCHSSTLINVEVKKRSRYLVRCKYCSKEVLSTSFKSHTAVHLKQPLMKCSICNKEFFRRDSCRQHLKTFHKKKPGEMKDLIILYEKNRLNHLYLRQKADIHPAED